jgi:hypothetical protein
MSNGNSYPHCYWHANGELACRSVPNETNPNNHANYVQFTNFSTPNQNYNPNGYRDQKEYYEQLEHNCNVPCNGCTKKTNPKPYQWLSNPHTFNRLASFKN